MAKSKKIIYPIVLSIISLLFIISTIAWIEGDGGVTFTSDAAHLFNASSHFRNLKALDIMDFMLTREIYPNLFHQLTAILALMTRDLILASALINTIFVAILIFGVYFLGSHLWNSDAGFLAALLIPAFPGIVLYSRINNIDIASAAAVIWALFFLIKSDHFQNRAWTIAFFASCAVGMLMKWAFAFFLFVPFVVTLWPHRDSEEGWDWKGPSIFFAAVTGVYAVLLLIVNILGKESPVFPSADNFRILYIATSVIGIALFFTLLYLLRARKSMKGNLALGMILYMVLTNHFYLYSFQFLARTYLGRFWGGMELQKHASTHNIYSFLVRFFILDNVGIPIMIFALVGILYYLFREKKSTEINLLLWSLGSGLILLALQPIYDSRYYLPFTGIIALFAIYRVLKISSKPLKALLLIPLILITSLTWTGWMILPKTVHSIFPGIAINRPIKRNWSLAEIVSFTWEDFRKNYTRGKRGLFIFQNESRLKGVKPLVLMFLISKEMGADENIYFFPENLDLRNENQGIPLMYYIIPGSEEQSSQGKDEQMETEKTESELDWKAVNPDVIYYVHFINQERDGKNDNSEGINSENLAKHLKSSWIRTFKNKRLIKEFNIAIPESGQSSPDKIEMEKVLIYRLEQ